MTAEERAQRLAEMTGNASVHDEARWSRQRRAREQDEAEEAANERRTAGAGPMARCLITPAACPAQVLYMILCF